MAERFAYDGVLFDLGNTLIPFTPKDSMEFVVKWYHSSGIGEFVPFSEFLSVFRYVSGKERERSMRESWESSVATRVSMIVSELDKRGYHANGTKTSLVSSHTESFSSCLRMKQSSRYVLDMIRAANNPAGEPVRCGLVSNAIDAKAIRSFLIREDLETRFDSIVISEEMGIAKPRKEIFETSLQELGLNANGCVYVGDRYHTDIEGARSVGMHAVYIREYHTAGEPPEGIEIDAVTIYNILDLIPVLSVDNIG
jgi:HAD superfamily hydrolase (TIGR01549 family)